MQGDVARLLGSFLGEGLHPACPGELSLLG